MRLESNLRSVKELNTFHPLYVEIETVHVRFRCVGAITPPSVYIIWACLIHVANWWVMRHLLHAYFSAIIMEPLVCFT